MTAIITTFNRSLYCKEAIQSVLSQTYQDFELLVLDNSSKDDTEKIVRGFNDARIRYIRHEPLNIAKARNLGWQGARGEYIAYLDDDDLWLPNKLEAELSIFEKKGSEVALVYGGFFKIDTDGNKIKEHHPVLQGKILEEILIPKDDFTGSASNAMIRKSALEALRGYDNHIVTGEDWELYLRLANRYTIEYTDETVLEIRQHAGPRLGDKLVEAAKLELFVMEAYKEIFDRKFYYKSFYLQRIGGKYIRSGYKKEGRVYLSQAIRANPLNGIAYLQYFFSFFGSESYRNLHRLQQKYFKILTIKILS